MDISELQHYVKIYEKFLKSDPTISFQDLIPSKELTMIPESIFSEIVADVSDEANRRMSTEESKPKLLPIKTEFTELRNSGGQNLSSLSQSNFGNCTVQVLAEIKRRYMNKSGTDSNINIGNILAPPRSKSLVNIAIIQKKPKKNISPTRQRKSITTMDSFNFEDTSKQRVTKFRSMSLSSVSESLFNFWGGKSKKKSFLVIFIN